jgi:hypothetical protein
MGARDTYIANIAAHHASAEIGGISGLPGASPPGNATTWSRTVARAALANGTITQSQFIAGWEQAQASSEKATLRSNSDFFPV